MTKSGSWSSELAGLPPDSGSRLSCSETRVGDRAEVAVAGDVDFATNKSLIATAARVISQGPGRLVLNLDGVPFMDSTGLAALVQIRRMCDEAGCTLHLSQLGRFVAALLKRTGLDSYLSTVQPTADTV